MLPTPYNFIRLIVMVKRNWLCIQPTTINAETSYSFSDIHEICAQVYTLNQLNKIALLDNNV